MTRIKITLTFLRPGIWGFVMLGSTVCLWAAANGSLSGTLKDQTGAVVSGATISLAGNSSADPPQFSGASLEINTTPRNGRPAFNKSAFATETLGQLGNVPQRFFYGPGISTFDLTVTKMLRVTESKSFEFRLEAFNAFNHAQFYGPAAVDGG